MAEYDEEYEVIPTSPIQRLEKRLNRVETLSSSSEVGRLIEQIIELIKSNQRVIDDVIKADTELRNEVSRIPGKIDDLLGTMNDFIEMLKVSAEQPVPVSAGPVNITAEAFTPLTKKFDEMLDLMKKSSDTSQGMLASLSVIDKRLKRLYLGMTDVSPRPPPQEGEEG